MKSLTMNPENMHWLDRLCRNALFRTLENLHTGCIRLHEGSQQHIFGNANDPEYDVSLQIHDAEAYRNIALNGSVGAGESYMTGDWSSDNLPLLIRVLARNKDVVDNIDGGLANIGKVLLKGFHYLNRNTEKGSRRNIAAHYDLGNDMFELFLDPTMMYSSGIFPAETSSMEEASVYKLDRICQKLQLTAEDHLVEIGTGWGSMAIHAAKHYGCKVTTTTISEEQFAWAERRVREEGLEDKITLLKKDYRALEGQFDKLVSIEMIEAVGHQFLNTYIETCSRLLKDDGIALIQAITIDDQRYEQAKNEVDFIKRYIFPGSFIPCVTAISQAVSRASDMKMIHMEDITPHYARTLDAWRQRFLSNKEQIKALGYDDTFIRLWDFYFAYCEGGFAERVIGDVQLIFAKPLNRRPPLLGAVNAE
ncbi:MAG: SAM-dependent methyltransferase [Thalassobium sp.]|uniref:Cyclopropane-fatty-acyl-phospholipid synthase family protein n=1 Tax=Thalassolituus pacificus TaxID=2975440 RepID=A0A9X3ARS6_9GAMM|nr:cyclopropane-fatty-acyl-phospholipid synthase family protein [Thalassolituus pacificus]MCT7358128.1 cyclopropane-fatty-acyl-phospholipid synthase family protein [Thalassolituus pacificus]PHS63623.1 MAG: SAM-dependent methyltransferase [Thalassobium sp.]